MLCNYFHCIIYGNFYRFLSVSDLGAVVVIYNVENIPFLMLNDFTVMLNLVWYTRSDLSNFNYFVLVSNLCFVSNFKESLYASLLVVDDKASFLLSIILWKYLDLMSMYLKDFDAFEFCVCVCVFILFLAIL